MDRVHRIGQRRTVNVYRLITQDSIEEQIMNLQAFKIHLARSIVNVENSGLTEMDTEHLFDRLSVPSNRVEPANCDGSNSLDELESCYETEYNLDAFVSRLKTN